MNSFQQVLYWLISGSKGGLSRAKILYSLEKEPMNSHALSQKVKLDYKTVQHHLKVLSENQLVVKTGGRYGQVFFLSPELKENWSLFKKMFDKKLIEGEKNGK